MCHGRLDAATDNVHLLSIIFFVPVRSIYSNLFNVWSTCTLDSIHVRFARTVLGFTSTDFGKRLSQCWIQRDVCRKKVGVSNFFPQGVFPSYWFSFHKMHLCVVPHIFPCSISFLWGPLSFMLTAPNVFLARHPKPSKTATPFHLLYHRETLLPSHDNSFLVTTAATGCHFTSCS